MISGLSLETAISLIQKEHGRDELSSHILCAHPSEQSWAVVSLRSPISVAFAISETELTPISYVGTVELRYIAEAQTIRRLETVLLDLASRRDHHGELINMIEAVNIAQENPTEPESENGVSEQS